MFANFNERGTEHPIQVETVRLLLKSRFLQPPEYRQSQTAGQEHYHFSANTAHVFGASLGEALCEQSYIVVFPAIGT